MRNNPKKQSGPPAEGPQNETTQDAVIWGINPVREALQHDPRSLSEVMVVRGKGGSKFQEIIDLARANQVRVRFVDADRLGVPAQYKHQGVVARQAEARTMSLPELLDHVRAVGDRVPPRILALDSIQDPRNLGAIFRSALAAGFSSVILTRERSAPLSGTVAKTSAGAINQLALSQVVNLAESLKIVRQRGFWIFGAVLDPSAISLYKVDFGIPVCLVIGGEGKGIRPLVQKQCDQLITIPMVGNFDSLNVSVAAAVIMFEVNRQQQHSPTN